LEEGAKGKRRLGQAKERSKVGGLSGGAAHYGKKRILLQQREMSEALCSKRAKLAFAGSSKEMLIYKDGVKAAL